MHTIESLQTSTGLSRYYVTKAARFYGFPLNRGRKPTEFSPEQIRKIRQFLKIVKKMKQ